MSKVVAIYGPPGAGKTTTAHGLVEHLGAAYLSSGDIARSVDPGALERGEMADRAALAEAFGNALAEIRKHHEGWVVVDGLPRDPNDVHLLPDNTIYVLVNCSPDIAIERQARRGRPGDDNPAIVAKRTTEQRRLMELDKVGGWSYRLAGWKQSIQTNDKTREQVISMVAGYLLGQRRTVA